MRILLIALPLVLPACVSRPAPPETPVTTDVSAALPADCSAEEFAIYFKEGETLPGDEAQAVMDAVATSFARCDLYRIEVLGHADANGDPVTNAAVSDARAKSVLSGLVARGLLAEKVKIRAYGETDAITASGKEEPLNRKTVVRLIPEA